MLSDLMRDGVMAVRADALIRLNLLDELHDHWQTMVSPGPSVSKPYLVQWLGRYPVYDPTSIWARIELAIRPVAEEYLDAPSRLHFYNLWESLPSDEPATDSQLWHRDADDARLLKAFLYLTDVTAGAGPLWYILGTHWRGSLRLKPKITPVQMPVIREPVYRVRDTDMAACVPESEWRSLCVPAGTLVLADTTGWHKGGHATTERRLCGVWEWTRATAPVRSRMR